MGRAPVIWKIALFLGIATRMRLRADRGAGRCGRVVYLAHCASCHLPDLGGATEATELAGSNFIRRGAHGPRATCSPSFDTTMPPGNRGNLGEENYVRPGRVPAVGQRRERGEPAADCGGSGRRRFARWPPGRCLRLFEKYSRVPTADVPGLLQQQTSTGRWVSLVAGRGEELRAGHRRDAAQSRSRRLADDPPQLSGWSYSPLTQITTANVKDLRLAWVWAMNDGGANQPTPIVHNGIIYLANTSNTVQALDGADRRSDLGKPHRSGCHARLRRHAQSGDL